MLPIALNIFGASPSINVSGTPYSTDIPRVNAGSGELQTALSIIFGIAGVLAVLMIIIGGLMFVTSNGNPQNSSRALKTIIFALVGLVISLLAEALVAFILGKL